MAEVKSLEEDFKVWFDRLRSTFRDGHITSALMVTPFHPTATELASTYVNHKQLALSTSERSILESMAEELPQKFPTVPMDRWQEAQERGKR